MSRKFFRNRSGELQPESEFQVDDNSWMKMKQGTFVQIVLGIAALLGAWGTLKSDSADHTKAIAALVAHQTVVDKALNDQHISILLMNQTVTTMDQKIDYLTGARRTRPPATPPQPTGTASIP